MENSKQDNWSATWYYGCKYFLQVDWPVDVVYNTECETDYNKIFQFLLQLKLAKYSVDHLNFDGWCWQTLNLISFAPAALEFFHQVFMRLILHAGRCAMALMNAPNNNTCRLAGLIFCILWYRFVENASIQRCFRDIQLKLSIFEQFFVCLAYFLFINW